MSEHVVPVRLYVLICAILLALTYVTVHVAFLDLGAFNTPAALVIASCKALLVILYFMHARYSPRLIGIVAATGVLFIGILLALTLSDYLSRGWLS